MDFNTLVKSVESYHPNPDLNLLKRAYEFAEKAHQGQVRASGEPYFTHVVETALLVAKLKLDIASVAAALLHDTIEDCDVTEDELAEHFGLEISEIVQGVTKLTRIEFDSLEERQAENFRKMLVAMARDIRVVLVKLCDRLHNMRTLEHLPPRKQRIKAKETKEIYAPIANRLGIHWLKSELEDYCLLYLRPEVYELIKQKMEERGSEWDKYIETVTKMIKEVLEANGISAAIKGRAKHFYSIWQKMEKNNLTFEEINDILGFRVIVATVRACYETLGVIHATWKPVPGRFKDYIAMPKPNMYQSLHTTVIGPEGQRIELQIRTSEMNRVAEEGIAAHWKYKEGKITTDTSFDLQWVRELVETQQYLSNPDEFIQSVKGELFPEEVFVFTPKGDLIRLPYLATPIDFAYAVHTDVGHQTTGAKVNGQIVPLDYKLHNGDTVEIITSKNHVPSKDWLNFVKTSKAKQRIRSFLRAQERAKSQHIGYELLAKDLRKVKQSIKKLIKSKKLLEIAQEMGLKSVDELYAEIGYGKINTTKVIAKVLPDETDLEEKLTKKASSLERIFQRAAKTSRNKVGVKVSGMDDILVRFAKCCEPLPGDRIVGFITRGRGVTIHLANCAQVLKSDPMRRLDVVWDTKVKAPRRIKLTVHSQDQIGVLANLTSAITTNGANIANAHVKTTPDGKAVNSFEMLIEDARQLENIHRALEMVPGVIKVERVRHMKTSINMDGETKRKDKK
ncbi:MAG: bifunctional (p)ppGpp synthetase/guanosine-3',5'-bis(diphosphate) 3'-pyrophosphohydrolase [Candidatus Dadabacteria bacterium]|nr:MAG: bifunctional (p)ppGpp synthetase/guanosine-3',5'-bis(diphosphate) 3'-pyrophosphohydrolase [Candidatus Dadabacteria bacterium]